MQLRGRPRLPRVRLRGLQLRGRGPGNALAGADYDAYAEIYYTLSDTVRADFKAQSAYWDQFRDSVPQKASNTVYDSFLKSNDQELGMQSYGACVNLLVHYYIDEAREALG